MGTFNIKAGDRSPTWETTLTDNAGTAINLVGATVTLDLIRIGANTKTLDGASVTLSDAANGQVQYTFEDGDTDIEGVYLAEWNVVYSGGVPETFPNEGYDVVYIERGL